MTKPCVKCGCADRYANGRCKPCKREDNSKYRASNNSVGRFARWYSSNKYSERERVARWRLANRGRVIESNASYYAANQEDRRATCTAWHVANPEAKRIYEQNYRARKRENGGALSRGLAERLFKLQRGKCACCGNPLGDDFHLDHVMPLKLGGANTDNNIQLLTAKCNLQKNAKHPAEFMRARGFLI